MINYIYVPECEEFSDCWYLKLDKDLYWVVFQAGYRHKKNYTQYSAYFTSKAPVKGREDKVICKPFPLEKFPTEITLEEINLYLLKILG